MDRTITVRIKTAPLPETVNGLCICNDNDSYIILLNDSLSEKEQKKAYIHEVLHIYHDDFNNGLSVDAVEESTNREILAL